MMMEWNNDQLARRAEVIAFATEQINPSATQRETAAHFSRKLWRACGDQGLLGMMIPKQHGGQDLDVLSCVRALESLGYASRDTGLNFAISAHLLACVAPVWEYGSTAQQALYLPRLCSGEWVASNAITEESAGSDVYNMASTAIKEADSYVLNGKKTYCSNGAVADLFVTYVLTNSSKGFFGGVSGFLIETEKNQIGVLPQEPKIGIRSCPLAELPLHNTRVDANQMLGKEGAGAQIFTKSMHWERICLGAIHLGAMDWLLEEAVKFVNQRKSGGQNLAHYQALTHPLSNYKVQLEGARLLTYQAAEALQGKSRKLKLLSSMSKLAVSECYKGLCLQLVQLYAGAAYRSPHPAEEHLRAALAATIYSGTSEIHRNLVAREIGVKPSK